MIGIRSGTIEQKLSNSGELRVAKAVSTSSNCESTTSLMKARLVYLIMYQGVKGSVTLYADNYCVTD